MAKLVLGKMSQKGGNVGGEASGQTGQCLVALVAKPGKVVGAHAVAESVGKTGKEDYVPGQFGASVPVGQIADAAVGLPPFGLVEGERARESLADVSRGQVVPEFAHAATGLHKHKPKKNTEEPARKVPHAEHDTWARQPGRHKNDTRTR